MGSNPSRKISLLGITHPVKGKTISGTEDAPGHYSSEALEAKKWSYVALLCIFIKIWAKDLVLDNL